jgi:hypothetical protein
MAILAPAAVLAAALTGFFIGLSHADKDLAPVQVDPASTVLPDALQPDIKLPPGAQKMPADTAVLPAEIRQQIADHFRDCHLLSAASGHDNDMHPVRIVLEIDAQSIIRIARVSPTDGQSIADPVFKAFAGQIGHKLVSADCATLPIPAYLHGRVKTVSLTLNVGVR